MYSKGLLNCEGGKILEATQIYIKNLEGYKYMKNIKKLRNL